MGANLRYHRPQFIMSKIMNKQSVQERHQVETTLFDVLHKAHHLRVVAISPVESSKKFLKLVDLVKYVFSISLYKSIND